MFLCKYRPLGLSRPTFFVFLLFHTQYCDLPALFPSPCVSCVVFCCCSLDVFVSIVCFGIKLSQNPLCVVENDFIVKKNTQMVFLVHVSSINERSTESVTAQFRGDFFFFIVFQ